MGYKELEGTVLKLTQIKGPIPYYSYEFLPLPTGFPH